MFYYDFKLYNLFIFQALSKWVEDLPECRSGLTAEQNLVEVLRGDSYKASMI